LHKEIDPEAEDEEIPVKTVQNKPGKSGISVVTLSAKEPQEAESLIKKLFQKKLIGDSQIINGYERMFMLNK
jgi:hypothetical protein